MKVNASHSAETFDRLALIQRLMGDEALATKIIESFVVDAREHLVTLGRAVSDGNADGVHRLSHALKGAAANVGAGALAEVFDRLEIAGRMGDLNGAAAWVPVVEERLQEFELTWRPLSHVGVGPGT